MKQLEKLKCFAAGSLLAMAGMAQAQQIVRPLSFPGGAGTTSNHYAEYVGMRFQVTTPMAIAGDKAYTTTPTTGTGAWGAAVTTLTDTVKFAPGGDTIACGSGTIPAGYFAGKIALVWRGNCEFGYKALQAQNAGAVAVVIVNNVSGGPVGMAAGASGASVRIPVFMISLDDGKDITAQIAGGNTVILSIVNGWGTGKRNDLGFVPGGYSLSANCAMPHDQLFDASRPVAYVQKEGAYVANFGTSAATNTRLSAQLSFQAAGASTWSLLHSDSVVLTNFPVADSIYGLYMPKYNIPSVSGKGKFDLRYTISSDVTDEFPGDNVLHHYFYTTDSLYSKGRYDFDNNKPYSTVYTGPSTLSTDPFIWFTPYYITKGGGYFSNIQYSTVRNGPGLLGGSDLAILYVFKWTDAPMGTTPADSFMESSELQLLGAGVKTYNGTSDSSFQTYTVTVGDSVGNAASIPVTGNSWYLIGAEMMAGYSLGVDGQLNGNPRAYGLKKFDNVYEFYNPIWFGDRRNSVSTATGNPTNMVSNPGAAAYPWAFDGTGSFEIDSVVFHNQKGLIPSLPFTTTRIVNSVGSVKTAFAKFEVFPNPTTDMLNANITFGENGVNKVVYNIIDNSGRVVANIAHENVGTSDVFTYNTASLATGHYYLVVATTDGRTSFKKFAVVK